MKEARLKRLKLIELLEKHKLGSRVGVREEGKMVAPDIETELQNLPERELLLLDFKGIEVFSHSFADEVIARSLSRLVSQEYGDKFFAVEIHQNELCEDLNGALVKRSLAMIRFVDAGLKRWEVLGSLGDELKETLHVIAEEGKASTGELADKKKDVSLQAWSNRVMELSRLRLVRRDRITGERGVKYENSFIV
jgi:hypothetical protein